MFCKFFLPFFRCFYCSVTHSCLTLGPHGLQHARLPCPSQSPGVCSNSCLLSQWCHPTISSSVVPFCSCIQSFPASGSFLMSQLFASGGRSIGVSASASVLPMNIQDWFSLGLTGLNSLLSKGLSIVFFNTAVQKHQFFDAQPSLWSNFHIHTSVQLLSCVRFFATPWIAACQASLSITNSRSSLRLMSIESVMPSSHLILCVPFSSCPQSLPASESFPTLQFEIINYFMFSLLYGPTFISIHDYHNWTHNSSVAIIARMSDSLWTPWTSLPGSSVHGIFQARILECVAMPSSRGSSQPRDRTWVSCIAGEFCTAEPPRKPQGMNPEEN